MTNEAVHACRTSRHACCVPAARQQTSVVRTENLGSFGSGGVQPPGPSSSVAPTFVPTCSEGGSLSGRLPSASSEPEEQGRQYSDSVELAGEATSGEAALAGPVSLTEGVSVVLRENVRAELSTLASDALDDEDGSLAASTRYAYSRHVVAFEQWCAKRGIKPFPTAPDLLLAYVEHRSRDSVDEDGQPRKAIGARTLGQAIAAIKEEHTRRNLPLPDLEGRRKRALKGLRKRVRRRDREEKARPLTPDELKQITRCIADGDKSGRRDRALLLIGFLGALRRAELSALDVEDITRTAEGLVLQIRRSKTDQEGEGQSVALHRNPYQRELCPVVAWMRYVRHRTTGPAFLNHSDERLSGQSVRLILRRRAAKAGVSLENLSGHSLRAGLITAAAARGEHLAAIQRQSRHKNLDVLLGYIRPANKFKENVTKGILEDEDPEPE